MFYSENFIYNGKHGKDYGIQIVSENNSVLNEYGVNFSDNKEITLTFCYADGDYAASWDQDILEFVHEWFISDEYHQFISEDNEDLIYLLKGVSITKRFTNSMQGLIDVVFELYENYAYKRQLINIKDTSNSFKIYNYSNLNNSYKPIIKLYNIKSESISISNITTRKSPMILDTNGINAITIDNNIGVVDVDGHSMITKCNRKWIEFKKGSNEIHIDGNCSVIIESLYPIMV